MLPKKQKKKKRLIAICYDFDGTLSPRNMQEDTIFKEYKIKPESFWREVSRSTKDEEYGKALCYLNKLIFDSRFQKKPLTKNRLGMFAKKLQYCPGVAGYLPRINRYVENEAASHGLNVKVEHYIISSGMKSILDKMSIRKYFKAVYACEYEYGKDKAPMGVKSVVNDAMKTQCLFRISKGKIGLHENVNERIKKGAFRIPFSQMIYIGDGDTDIPSMTVARKYGGHAIAVYPPGQKAKKRTMGIFHDGRAAYVAAADYSRGSKLEQILKTILKDTIKKIANCQRGHE